ncbi:MAG: DUF4954 family protein, partial [Bacteroidota bacterium]|nr:DUF4954 family protein [Bacteroidota bacterium]
PMPFCLVSNDVSANKLVIMPAYWFMYNMYALARNAAKYADRDKRSKKLQHIEYSFLAPDSVNEIFTALDLLRKFTAHAVKPELKGANDAIAIAEGERLLNDPAVDFRDVEIHAEGFECTNRPTQIIKAKEAYDIYKKLVVYYAVEQICQLITQKDLSTFDALQEALPKDTHRSEWVNIGGQLLPKSTLQSAFDNIKRGAINSWNEVHAFYSHNSKAYPEQKLQHAYASLLDLLQINPAELTRDLFLSLLQEALDFKVTMVQNIHVSRAKDYQNSFRAKVYDNEEEMEEVVGRLEDNAFIKQQQAELENFQSLLAKINRQFAVAFA